MLIRLFVPIAYREPQAGDVEAAREWSLLDTVDNLAPKYDRPMTEAELVKALKNGGCVQTERQFNAVGLAVSGVKS